VVAFQDPVAAVAVDDDESPCGVARTYSPTIIRAAWPHPTAHRTVIAERFTDDVERSMATDRLCLSLASLRSVYEHAGRRHDLGYGVTSRVAARMIVGEYCAGYARTAIHHRQRPTAQPGNPGAATYELQAKHELRTCVVLHPSSLSTVRSSRRCREVHAGLAETSVMLASHPATSTSTATRHLHREPKPNATTSAA